eukprot:m.75880 g.75880  ORF g.75880 m.75880 type:complete len:64 (+) comp8098_c0_seq1:1364-1555(+)
MRRILLGRFVRRASTSLRNCLRNYEHRLSVACQTFPQQQALVLSVFSHCSASCLRSRDASKSL